MFPVRRVEKQKEKEEAMKNLIKRFIRNEEGQDLIEYALLIVLIAVVCVAAITLLGPTVAGVYTEIRNALLAA